MFNLHLGITSIKQPLPASLVNMSKYKSVPSPLITINSQPSSLSTSIVSSPNVAGLTSINLPLTSGATSLGSTALLGGSIHGSVGSIGKSL